MKKFSCLMLVLMMLFSLSACSGGPSPEEMEKIKKYEKYENLISLLEKEDYAAAIADVESRMPEPTAPEFTEVKITMDNYLDYFNVELKDTWHINSFGEADNFNIGYYLTIKDEFAPRLTNIENTNIDVKSYSKLVAHHFEYSFQEKTYSIGNIVSNFTPAEMSYTETFNGSTFSKLNSGAGENIIGAALATGFLDPNSYSDIQGHLVHIPEDFEILDIQGSIFLTE